MTERLQEGKPRGGHELKRVTETTRGEGEIVHFRATLKSTEMGGMLQSIFIFFSPFTLFGLAYLQRSAMQMNSQNKNKKATKNKCFCELLGNDSRS